MLIEIRKREHYVDGLHSVVYDVIRNGRVLLQTTSMGAAVTRRNYELKVSESRSAARSTADRIASAATWKTNYNRW